jgi:hypothetical protein
MHIESLDHVLVKFMVFLHVQAPAPRLSSIDSVEALYPHQAQHNGAKLSLLEESQDTDVFEAPQDSGACATQPTLNIVESTASILDPVSVPSEQTVTRTHMAIPTSDEAPESSRPLPQLSPSAMLSSSLDSTDILSGLASSSKPSAQTDDRDTDVKASTPECTSVSDAVCTANSRCDDDEDLLIRYALRGKSKSQPLLSHMSTSPEEFSGASVKQMLLLHSLAHRDVRPDPNVIDSAWTDARKRLDPVTEIDISLDPINTQDAESTDFGSILP